MTSGIIPTKIRDFSYSVSEGAFGLVINLLVMILVERHLGERGLGIFSYLLSLYFIIGFISDFGISKFVEHALATGQVKERASKLFSYAFQAVLLVSIFFGIILIFTAAFDTAQTRVEEKIAAYFILALILPFRNLNKLLLSFLEAKASHDITAKLKIRKRLILIGLIYVFLLLNVPASLLMIGYLISEAIITINAWIKVPLSLSLRPWIGWRKLRILLSQSSSYLFTDDVLDVVLYLDFFLLGFFISSEALGVYAEASILVRAFLIIPFGLKPLFYSHYCRLASQGRNQEAAIFFKRSTAVLFFILSALSLYILVYYPVILHKLFYTQGYDLISFRIFSILLPGLLLFSTFSIHEPIYEALGDIRVYQKLVLLVSFINLFLNAFMIPFAGFIGAAWATTISLFFYFFLFGRRFKSSIRINKKTYLLSSGVIYFLYILFHKFEPGFWISIWMIPLFLFIILSLLNLFNFEEIAT